MVREAGSCCSNAKAVEGTRNSDKERFSIRSVSSLTGMSIAYGSITCFSTIELKCSSS